MLNEKQIAVLRFLNGCDGRRSWQLNAALYGPTEVVENAICRPAVELLKCGMLSRRNGVYTITEFGRKAFDFCDGVRQ